MRLSAGVPPGGYPQRTHLASGRKQYLVPVLSERPIARLVGFSVDWTLEHWKTAGQKSLLHPEAIREPGADADIILAIVNRVRNPRVDPIGLHDGEAEPRLELRSHPAARGDTERIAVDSEFDIDIFLRPAEQHLPIGNKTAGVAPAVSGSEEVIEDGNVLPGIVDVVRMCQGDVGHGAPRWRYVVKEGRAPSIEPEATTLTRRCIGMEVVVIQT